MKKVLAGTIALVVLLVLVVPAVVIHSLFVFVPPNKSERALYKGEDIVIRVYLPDQDKIMELNLEEYIKGVVAAEMPAQFEPEALKAQAVAARTYAVKNMIAFGGKGVTGHPGADISTDHKEGQAWLDEKELVTRWGPLSYTVYWNKISKAVEETRGIIITYQGEPIHAVFHSTSGERTASAQEVWGFDYPYLKSVPCQWDKQSPRYSDAKTFALSDIAARLGEDTEIITAAQNPNGQVAEITEMTDSGRVSQVRIGSKVLSGSVVRDKLELRSTNFQVQLAGDKMIFKTIGYGHGVGLCQYGADGMAKEGKDYKYILRYYYTGIDFKNILES
ncbi:hypothetical protein P22_1571 [Propionispora sp. 2/2-37]|uniref:stage II sporulation protein D n=1 Tax=Propionispora sp. 2/2-37 TaxID=1677858 RepID=UPI0006BB5E4C|nr:stage II sporulation protein D [Propionispora sp. 2/2-37]CUH95500.1 hypothetical protein P22_1571 [Propionispora sp. 2/2-37]